MKVTARKNQMIMFEQFVDLCDSKQKLMKLMEVPIYIFNLNSETRCSTRAFTTACQKDKKVLEYSKTTELLYGLLEKSAKLITTRVYITHDTGKTCYDFEHKFQSVH